MRYMLLIHIDENTYPDAASDRGRELSAAFGHFRDETLRVGSLVAGERLQLTDTATTVRMENGQVVTLDGPYAETKEQLGGFFIVDCPDRDTAITLAGKVPAVQEGAVVEVRPVWEMGAA
ncbi:MAG: YciI family protein [Hyphomicrobiales bacterium]